MLPNRGQRWMVFNLDKEERGSYGGVLGEFLFNGSPGYFINILTQPPPIGHFLASAKYVPDHSVKNDVGFLQFPNEILDVIFAEFHGLEDIISLSITHSHFLPVGIKHAEKLKKSRLWVGDRIICIGNHDLDNDLPQGLLTQEQEQKFKNYIESKDTEQSRKYRNFFSFAESYFRSITVDNNTTVSLGNDLWKYISRHGSDRDLFLCFTTLSYNSPGPYALCNLSKWEYVRSEAIIELTGATMRGTRPQICGVLGFGQVLLTQICWSSDSSTSLVHDGSIHRGPWAGDRIGIIRSNEMPPVTEEGKEWKDGVLCEVEKIWKAEYRACNWEDMQSYLSASARCRMHLPMAD